MMRYATNLLSEKFVSPRRLQTEPSVKAGTCLIAWKRVNEVIQKGESAERDKEFSSGTWR
jgi:hypothetical protein